MPSSRLPQVKISLSHDQLDFVNAEAERTGLSRAELLREWAFSDAASLPKGPTVYSDAVEAAASTYSGIPRSTMESIVSAVIISLNEHAKS